MSCGRDAEFLKSYLDADGRFDEVMIHARTLTPGVPVTFEWLTDERLAEIDRRREARDAAEAAWLNHLSRR